MRSRIVLSPSSPGERKMERSSIPNTRSPSPSHCGWRLTWRDRTWSLTMSMGANDASREVKNGATSSKTYPPDEEEGCGQSESSTEGGNPISAMIFPTASRLNLPPSFPSFPSFCSAQDRNRAPNSRVLPGSSHHCLPSDANSHSEEGEGEREDVRPWPNRSASSRTLARANVGSASHVSTEVASPNRMSDALHLDTLNTSIPPASADDIVHRPHRPPFTECGDESALTMPDIARQCPT